jgi:hypothetical protein
MKSRGGWGGIMSIATLQNMIARLEGELGGRGLEFEEDGGRVEMREFIILSLSVFLSIRLG